MSDAFGAQSLLEVGAASAALHGENVSGDQQVVVPFTGGVLVGAVDGLGHGDEAAQAAHRAVSVLEEDAAAPLTTLFERCHSRLARTRGVVMSLASFNVAEHRLTWLGVGNVEGTLLRADSETPWPTESILLLGGVVGFQLPSLRPSTTQVRHGDTVILTTDGIESGFRHGLRP
ncbi:MAG TPA: SpoIIE family protein phosphatase, partial [Thermoleophilaceae bacterium]|nr:SpoIIE family protein phosphatase [Thermoleophilaceae bacterium]